jgi:hypothetical protein
LTVIRRGDSVAVVAIRHLCSGTALINPGGGDVVSDRALALAGKTDRARWSNPASFESAWDARAEFAAQFMPAGARVLDLGCGRMSLQRFLPRGCSYRGCDLLARDARTIVCDFNAGQFPAEGAAEADTSRCSAFWNTSPMWTGS